MRSTVEPLPREEDTAQVRCRDTGSEGGEFGARLSDVFYMNSTELVGNMKADMSAMQKLQVKTKVASLEGRAKPQVAG